MGDPPRPKVCGRGQAPETLTLVVRAGPEVVFVVLLLARFDGRERGAVGFALEWGPRIRFA